MRRTSNPIVCYNCQQEGHIAPYCPNTRAHQDYVPLCWLCSGEGHEEKDCPTRQVTTNQDKGKQKIDEGVGTSTNLVEIESRGLLHTITVGRLRKRVTFGPHDPRVNIVTRSQTQGEDMHEQGKEGATSGLRETSICSQDMGEVITQAGEHFSYPPKTYANPSIQEGVAPFPERLNPVLPHTKQETYKHMNTSKFDL